MVFYAKFLNQNISNNYLNVNINRMIDVLRYIGEQLGATPGLEDIANDVKLLRGLKSKEEEYTACLL